MTITTQDGKPCEGLEQGPFEPIAVVGVGALMPDAPSIDAFWQNIIENAREDVVASDHFDIEGTKTAMPQTQAATKGMMTSGLQTPALVCPPPGPRPPAQSRTIRETIASHTTARLPLLDSIATETDAKIRMPPLTREKAAASLMH